MRILLKHLILGAVLSLSTPLIVQADNTWIIKTPQWELSKQQYESTLSVKHADPKQLTKPEQQQLLQDIYIRESLMYQALEQGLDKDPKVLEQLEEMRRDLLARNALEQQVNKNKPDFAVRAKELYQARLATDYSFPVRYKLQIIQLNAVQPEQKTKAQERLTQIRADLEKNTLTFAQAVERYSEAADKALTQNGQWYKVDQLPTELAEPLTKLTPDSLSTVINANHAVFLVKYLEKRDPEVISFEKIKDELIQRIETEYRMGQQKMILDELRQRFSKEAQLNLEP
jgi:peptidyl-prolyl cis-trans isomerase C